MNNYEKQLESIYKNVTSVNFGKGMRWYSNARWLCENFSKRFNIPLFKVVGVMSALSPRNKWDNNVMDTMMLLKYGDRVTTHTFGANKRKALKIINQAKCSNDVITILNSDKTVNFFKNIYNKNDLNVTVDVWAMRAVGYNKAITPKSYEEIATAYYNVALKHGILPKQFQAIIWETVRSAS